jgi:hypothetical protein
MRFVEFNNAMGPKTTGGSAELAQSVTSKLILVGHCPLTLDVPANAHELINRTCMLEHNVERVEYTCPLTLHVIHRQTTSIFLLLTAAVLDLKRNAGLKPKAGLDHLNYVTPYTINTWVMLIEQLRT